MVRSSHRYAAPIALLAVALALAGAYAQELEPVVPTGPAADIAGENYVEFGPSPQEGFTSLQRFGASLFAHAAEQAAAGEEGEGVPVAGAPVPSSYIIGPTDRLSLDIWAAGFEQINEEFTVSPEGFVTFPQLGRMTAAGQSLDQLRASLVESYGRLFTNPTLTLVVSEQRTVEVYVTGDVVRPGKYALSGMATALTALYAAGGPSEIGSYRDIRLSRLGQAPVTLDLYDYLLTGSRESDALLNPGDTIFVPPLGGEVGLAGEVRRPARYELVADVTLADALAMAGGLTATAYGPVVQLWRADAQREWQLTAVDVSTPDSPDLRTPLRDGDLIIANRLRSSGGNVITLVGAVKRPGYYPAATCPTVSALLDAAEGLAWNAHVGTGVIRRMDAERHLQIIEFNVARARAQDPAADLALQAKDTVEIFAQQDIERRFEVEVSGAVARPGVYFWAADLRISHLLLRAGGPLPGAYLLRADLLRLTEAQTYETIPVNLQAAVDGDAEANLALKRGDILKVITRAEAGLSDEVHIAGFVNNPGKYPRREGMKISDLIFAAGGLTPGAGPSIELVRGHFEGAPEAFVLELRGELDNFTIEPDAVLTDEDSVAVAGRGEFREHADLVHLQGQLHNPGSYAMKTAAGEDEYTVWDLIAEGGGLLADANPAGIVIYRQRKQEVGDAQSEDLQRVLKAVNHEATQPALQVDAEGQEQAIGQTVAKGLQQVFTNDGSVSIVLPPRPVTESDWVAAIPVDGEALIASNGREGNLALQPGDTVSVPARVYTLTVLGAVPRSGAVPYQDGLHCRDYITESGGLREDAAAARLVVVHANGSVEPVRLRDSMAAGDIIVVPTRHIVRTVRTESELKMWLRSIVPLATTALLVR